ncbi:hypothetical protein PUN28_006092 [Cardiocondyla obscurior]|uniref:Uncharacterized protein n=1 Tax=Cardiocondyla obscurior TaxID=286306 RepID=A0AAW2G783_9HYME
MASPRRRHARNRAPGFGSSNNLRDARYNIAVVPGFRVNRFMNKRRLPASKRAQEVLNCEVRFNSVARAQSSFVRVAHYFIRHITGLLNIGRKISKQLFCPAGRFYKLIARQQMEKGPRRFAVRRESRTKESQEAVETRNCTERSVLFEGWKIHPGRKNDSLRGPRSCAMRLLCIQVFSRRSELAKRRQVNVAFINAFFSYKFNRGETYRFAIKV